MRAETRDADLNFTSTFFFNPSIFANVVDPTRGPGRLMDEIEICRDSAVGLDGQVFVFVFVDVWWPLMSEETGDVRVLATRSSRLAADSTGRVPGPGQRPTPPPLLARLGLLSTSI